MSEVTKEPETTVVGDATVVDERKTVASSTTEITGAEEEAANTSTKRARESDDEQTKDSELKKDDTKRTKLDDLKDSTTTTTTTTTTSTTEEPKAVEKPKTEEKPKFVFGSTTTFGSAGGFSMFGGGKNVFGGSTFGSSSPFGSTTPKESKPVENKSGEESTLSNKSTTATEETSKETETKQEKKTETTDGNIKSTESETTETTKEETKKSTPSVFGSGSSFGNAFQMSINKKSIFDTNGEENKEEKKQDGESQTREGYQVVHLEKQEVKSGEEDETTLISVKAKLYHLDLTNVSDGWKEKGIGILKVNKLAKPQENYSTRIVMRQDGIYKLILNVPVVKGFEVYRGMTSSLSSAKFVRIQFIENGKPTQYALKMSLDNAANLYEIIEPLIPK